MKNQKAKTNDDEAVRRLLTANYEKFSQAFANRDADTLMGFFLPTYTVSNCDNFVMDYAAVEKDVRWEAGAEWNPPRALLFEVQDVQLSAVGTEAFVSVEVTRKGKGAQMFVRRDTWNLTPQGWRLRQTVS